MCCVRVSIKIVMKKNNIPKTLYEFAQMIQAAPIEWVQQNIHPFVRRGREDDRSYLRKMALYAQATNTYYEETI